MTKPMNVATAPKDATFQVRINSDIKRALEEQAIAMLMMDLKRAEERAEREGWIESDELERELNV